ncbi:MAG: hypothetical protein SFT92_08985 [Rickettsiales bacterium]|nr:hypothetical protein [Rickettsiales bacterium]
MLNHFPHRLSEIAYWLRWQLMGYRDTKPVEAHRAIMDRVAERFGNSVNVKDETERLTRRCLAHFLCQLGLRTVRSRCLTELIAAVIIIPLTVWWTVKSLNYPALPVKKKPLVRWNKEPARYQNNPAIYHTPPELSQPEAVFAQDRYLRMDDWRLIHSIARLLWKEQKRYSIQLLFKITKELSWMRYLIEHHPADEVLIDGEFDCALSIMTLYCHRHGQKLYNVMHGDKFGSAKDAFFEVDRCYCWNEFYINQFIRGYASSDFRIYDNPSFIKNPNAGEGRGLGVILPIQLYLPGKRALKALCDILNHLAERNTVSLRAHPAFAQECERLRDHLSPAVIITDFTQETSRQFIEKHQIILGTASTAMLEAVMIGKQTVCIDCPQVASLAAYHFMFTQANCQVAEMAALEDALTGLLSA